MRALSYFTFKDLIHDRWRSMLTVLSLGVIVTGYLLLAALAQALGLLTRQAQVSNNLLIVAAGAIDPQDSSLDEGILKTALDIAPGQILQAFPIIFRHLTIDGHILQVRAVGLDEMSTALGLTLVQGSWPVGTREVVVSEGAAQLAGWIIGSRVNVYGTDFQVTGVVHSAESAFGSVWMTTTEGQSLFGTRRGFQVGYLSLAASANSESLRLKLQADPRIAAQATIYLENVFTNDYNQSTSNLVILSSLMVLVSLLAITLGIYNATSLHLAERSLEIGLLRVIGFTRPRIRGFLYSRALMLTLAAYGLGWTAAMMFIAEQRLHSPGGLVFLTLNLTPFSTLLGLALAAGFACLGTWLTSRRLASVNLRTGGE